MIITLSLFFVVIVLFLAAPLELHVASHEGEQPMATLCLFDKQLFRTTLKRPSQRRAKDNRAGQRSDVQQILEIAWRFRPFLALSVGRPGQRLLVRTIKSVDVAADDAAIEFGLADPSETGRLYALLSALSYQLEPRLSFIPDFTGKRLNMSGSIHIKSSLARLVWPSLLFSSDPAVMSALWRVLKSYLPRNAAA